MQLTIVASLFSAMAFAQKGKVTGKILDATTKEPLIGATVTASGSGKGTSAEIDGSFSLPLPDGTYVLSVSYVTYKSVTDTITVAGNTIELEFLLEPTTLNEVEITTDIAKPRETPVAFSNITGEQIRERLGTADLPMLLNVTPGVYASQKEGGDGQADVRIRGFGSQNVLTMIDGIPMNDMYNGRVYWSNWGGLGNNTKIMQVQRGLGATKLAIPSVGGSINLITQGIESEKYISIRQDYGNRFNAQTVISASSGKLKGGWNVQGSLSYKYNGGWVDETTTQLFTYYLKVNKQIKNHIISFSAMGGPQWSNQRSFIYPFNIETINKDYAANLGIDTSALVKEMGWRYNRGWGKLRRTRADESGPDAVSEIVSTNRNEYFKPIFFLRDFIKVNEKLHVAITAYASFGIGGGTQLAVSNASLDSTGQVNLQAIYDANSIRNQFNIYITPEGDTLQKSSNWLRMDRNDHSWIGALGTFDYAITRRLTLSGGLDFRYFNGKVYSTVDDLLGGDLVIGNPNLNVLTDGTTRAGELTRQNYSRDILWGGAFAMLEYKHPVFSAFVNVSSSLSAYKQYNFFAKRQLVLNDTILEIGYSDTLTHDGTTYTRDAQGLRINQSDWLVKLGYVFKGGMNFNIGQHHNIFFNVGYFSRVPYMSFIVNNDNTNVRNAKNEEVGSFELGYGIRYKKFAMNLNGYYTIWLNNPVRATVTDPISGDNVVANVNDIEARHMGIELDFKYNIIKQLSFEGSVSIGDWTWNSIGTAEIRDELGNLQPGGIKQVDLRGIKLGNQPQHQYALIMRVAPFKGFYIAPQIILFTHYYANYEINTYTVNPVTGVAENAGRQAWRLPDYYTVDLNMGYGFKVKKVKIDLRANFMNLTNNFYLTDAEDNLITANATFSAISAGVNVGLGFRYMGSVQITF